MMDVQTLLNFAFTGILALAGLVYKGLINRLEEQEKTIEKLNDRIHELDKLVAGDYLKRKEFNDVIQTLFEKLDNISGKLDKKADKRSTD